MSAVLTAAPDRYDQSVWQRCAAIDVLAVLLLPMLLLRLGWQVLQPHTVPHTTPERSASA
jgi:hypothetical protein